MKGLGHVRDLVAEQVVYGRQCRASKFAARPLTCYLRFSVEGFRGDWHLTVNRIIGEGRHTPSWIEFSDAGDGYPGVCLFDLGDDGRTARITDFWPTPTELPAAAHTWSQRY